MIIKHPSHLNLTHSRESILPSHFQIIPLQKTSPTTITLRLRTDSKTCDESSNSSDLSQEQRESTSFTNIFIVDQTLISTSFVLLVTRVYIKCIGLIKITSIDFYINIYTFDKYPNKA